MFETEYIEEPNLLFGNRKEEKDPRVGITYHGPYHYSSEEGPSPNQIKVGIIGDSVSLTLTKRFLEALKQPINSFSANKWLYPNYSGLNKDGPVKCGIDTSKTWEATIRSDEITHVINIVDVNKRIAEAANLFKEKLNTIVIEDNKPDVVICSLPKQIEDFCGTSRRTRGAKRPKFTDAEKLHAEFENTGQKFLSQWGLGLEPEDKEEETDRGMDLHNAIKGRTMESGIPVQILRQSTTDEFLKNLSSRNEMSQEPSTFAWNFAMALYYKANGKPWRLAKLDQDTCYVGISFFHNLMNPNLDVQTSMAQVFTVDGEGLVVRGKDVVKDRVTKQVHIPKAQAEKLMIDALNTYRKRSGREPAKIVIHKTTLFSDDEIEGFSKAIGQLSKDFVTLNPIHPYRFARSGQYPILRGTMIEITPNMCLLFTSGYTPRLRTYPGHRIPKPLMVTHYGDSEMLTVCKDILSLTKLDWNTTAFSTYTPITLSFSKKVGKVLSELPENSKLQNHYRFYM